MLESSRLQQLRELLKEDPTDPFLNYGIAMELLGIGDDAGAAHEFRELTRKDPNYVPSYLMLGQTLHRLGRIDEAVAVLRDGVIVAKRVGNEHALSEMQALLAILE